MKKVFALLLALLLLCSVLAGCGGTATLPVGTDAAADKESAPKESVPETAAASDLEAVKAALSGAGFGDKVTFGTWEQDGDETNGPEPISWIVVKQGVGQALLLSEYCLENMVYHAERKASWETSDLRAWLNGTFWEEAFTDAERASIALTHTRLSYVENYERMSAEVDDYVLLLSYDDANRYLSGCGRLAYGILTEHAMADDPYLTEVTGVEGVTEARDYWLMDSGNDTEWASEMTAYTVLPYRPGTMIDGRCGVRPAVWFVYDEALKTAYEAGTAEPPADAALEQKLAQAQVGDVISFGAYDADYYNAGNWKQIEWKVVDEQDGKLLLLAECISDYLPYMDERVEECSWDTSDLRAKLNGDAYLDLTFTPQERAKLCLTAVRTEGSEMWDRPGCESEDLLFLPAKEELSVYVGEDVQTWALNGTTYWLRNPDFVDGEMSFVYAGGGTGVDEAHCGHGIRLMAWIAR